MVQCAMYYDPILMKELDEEYLHVVQESFLEKIARFYLIKLIVLKFFVELINLLKKDFLLLIKKILLQYFLPQIIAIGNKFLYFFNFY